MTVALVFRKDIAERYLKCFVDREAIPPPSNAQELLTLIGACSTFLLEPVNHPSWLVNANPLPQATEPLEARIVSVDSDLRGIIEFVGHLVSMVRVETYDSQFEPLFRAMISFEDGKPKIMPIEGRKGE